MAACGQIEQLLRDPRIWPARGMASAASSVVATGWPSLDHALGGGWPLGQLTELLVDGSGTGEITLLLPALVRLLRPSPDGTEPGDWAMFVAPPHVPYAPALRRAGVDLARLLVVQARREPDVLWAMEQALRPRSCAAVVGWSQTAGSSALRRLQLAAEESGAWVVLLRPAHRQPQRSPAPLRIGLRRGPRGYRLDLHVIRRRGGVPVTTGVDVDGGAA